MGAGTRCEAISQVLALAPTQSMAVITLPDKVWHEIPRGNGDLARHCGKHPRRGTSPIPKPCCPGSSTDRRAGSGLEGAVWPRALSALPRHFMQPRLDGTKSGRCRCIVGGLSFARCRAPDEAEMRRLPCPLGPRKVREASHARGISDLERAVDDELWARELSADARWILPHRAPDAMSESRSSVRRFLMGRAVVRCAESKDNVWHSADVCCRTCAFYVRDPPAFLDLPCGGNWVCLMKS